MFSCGLFESHDEPPYTSPIIFENQTITWGGSGEDVIEISRDLIFEGNSTLIILPGTKIEHTAGTVLVPNPAGDMTRPPIITIKGEFIAVGEENSPIHFNEVEGEKPSMTFEGDSESDQRVELEWVTGLGYVEISDYSPSIINCEIRHIALEDCDSTLLQTSIFNNINYMYSTGLIIDNTILSQFFSLSSGLLVQNNMIGSDEKMYRGIYNSHDDSSFFQNNTISNFENAIYIFSGSPTFRNNNITNYDIAIQVQPFIDDAESDTLDFTQNW